MTTEKFLCLGAVIVAGLLTLLFVLDAAVSFPFGRASLVFDILAACAGGFILWQGIETYREFR